ncbi:TRAP transporter small permease [Salinarimonas ramus]|uniref:TRAP transporter small permease protein n=1 Tax=Salinarimonas ramus TaxID=690164 RepID=A0A917V382_9HYPH|nr:TRAP transporter small permease [Salinarimonas ramus]GGK29702.1 C4-dicarboxylate ABC transporter [Salinarimonas ramus]
MLTALKLVDRAVFHVTLTLAMILLVTMAAVSFYQVTTRFVFEQPSTWSEVTSRSLQIWMVYLGLVAAFRTGSLMAVDMLQRLAPKTLKIVVICAIAGLNLGVLAVMFWYGWSMAERVRFQTLAGVDNPFTGGGISIAIVYTAIPVGAALSIVAVIARFAEEVSRASRGEPVNEAEARARLETEGA